MAMKYQEIINSMRAEREEIEKLIKGKGSSALPEIAKSFSIKPSKARRFLKEAGLLGIRHKPNFKLEELAQEGLPQAAIAARLGLTRQAISSYLIRREQIGEYKKERQNVKKQQQDEKSTRMQYITQFHDLMIQRALKLARQESWAAEQAFLHCLLPRFELRKFRRFEKVKKLFSNYDRVIAKGGVMPYLELAEKSGIKYASDARRLLLRRMTKESIKSSRKRNICPEEIKQAIEKAYSIHMHQRDIAFLVGLEYSKQVPASAVGNEFLKKGKREDSRYHIAAFEYGNRKRKHLNYRDASQVYEAADLKFKRTDISTLLGLEKEMVDYALEFRDCIEKKIISALNTINPGKKHTKPY